MNLLGMIECQRGSWEHSDGSQVLSSWRCALPGGSPKANSKKNLNTWFMRKEWKKEECLVEKTDDYDLQIHDRNGLILSQWSW